MADRPRYEGVLHAKLAMLAVNEGAHNRWKLLCDYPASNTARNSASRLRRRYPGPTWDFKTTKRLANGRYGVGVMYKRPQPDGRAPEEP